MDLLLKHLVDITANRDHGMLDIAVISAVQELAGASQTRVLEIMGLRNEVFIRPRATIACGFAARFEDDPGDQPGQAIANYPALAACISEHAASAEHTAADGTLTIWLPVWLNEKVNVCLEIVNPAHSNDQTLQVIQGVVSVYRNFQNLLDYSERDSLTGLLNRKTFDDQFAKILSSLPDDDDGANDITIDDPASAAEDRRHPANRKTKWLAVIDIDHFKRINDGFGHIYGDEVLILIANLMLSSFRVQDRVFRFGGEEFVVLLRATTLADARSIVERFRANVESHHFPQVGQITVSIGFALINPGESPVTILGHADQALYYGKSNGRNMVCHYDELVEQGLLQSEKKNDDVEFF